MTDAAFAGAGSRPGFTVWRIENLSPVLQPEGLTGKFYSGDSYIVLSTTQSRSGKLSQTIHFWLGEETTQDESGVAAYKTVELDEGVFGGSAVQYREVQGNESQLFLSYFKDTGGIEYLPGGIASGFKHVERDVYEPRLLHLKGKRTVRVSEVPISRESLNKGDVFILDLGLTLFLFNGPESNKFERSKGVEVASKIDGDQRGGRANIILLSEDPTNEQFWSSFGGYVDPNTLPEGPSDDSVAPVLTSKHLFHLSDASGSVQFTEVPNEGGKFNREMLNGDDVFILSTGEKVFVWVGKGASVTEKREAMPRATEFVRSHNMPLTTSIERVNQGSESSQFKSQFTVWTEPEKVRAAAPPVNVGELLTGRAAEDSPIDDGSGQTQIWVVQDFNLVPVNPAKYGQFFGGDSYVILYTYIRNRVENHFIFFWLGNTSTADERGAAALLAKKMDDDMGGRPVQVRVTQGKEPSQFRSIFKGKMIVHAGGHASGFKNRVDSDSYDEDGVALFHVRGTTSLNTVGVQVAEKASSLNSEDCFVLVTPTHAFVWKGLGGNEDEAAVATSIATTLAGDYLDKAGREVVQIVEGSEPEEFWAPLGGRGDYPRRSPGQPAPRDPRLFECSTATGSFRATEVENFTQQDLMDEDVYILDTWTQIFVWMGSRATEEEKSKVVELAQRFVTEADSDRDPEVPIITVLAGNEPSIFSCFFPGWDSDYLASLNFKDPYQARLDGLAADKARKAALNTPVSAPVSTPVSASPAPAASSVESFPYEVLKTSVPTGVDPTKKETYLSDAEFSTVIGMSRADFDALPKWKKDTKKKAVGLF